MTTNANKSGAKATDGAKAEQTAGTKGKSTYTVKDGDSIEKVAAENDMTVEELVSLNPEANASVTGNNMLYTGQELRLK